MFGATLGVVASGLEVLKKAIDIRNRNILNASNVDYAREEPIIKSFVPAGVSLEDIFRSQSFYYMSVRNQKLSVVSYLDVLIRGGSQVEDLLQEFTQGLGGSEYLNRFFSAYQDLMREPSNEGARSELVSSAQSLVSFLKDRRKDMERLVTDTDYQLRQVTSRINSITRRLAQINQEILEGYAQTYARGRDYKNILDERDRYLRELSELINVRVYEDEIGRVRVETSHGFVLVENRYSWELRYVNGKVLWKSKDNSEVDISQLLSGGRLKGLLDLREDLNKYANGLEALGKRLISEVKLPVSASVSSDWFWMRNVSDLSAPVGFSGSISFYFPGGSAVISYTQADSLSHIVAQINQQLGGYFTADLLSNPDGTYTMRIRAMGPDYRVEDSNQLIQRAQPLFTGEGIKDMRVSPNAEVYVRNLDYEKVDEFANFSRDWWEGAKALYSGLVNSVATRQRDLKEKHQVEKALLDSMNARLQEMQGVSIDEEFMELMKLQRHYEALARIVKALDELLQTTINMT